MPQDPSSTVIDGESSVGLPCRHLRRSNSVKEISSGIEFRIDSNESNNKEYPDQEQEQLRYQVHQNQIMYYCDICSYSTSRKQHLSYHQLVHTGEKPHKCHSCSYSTAVRSNLIKHFRVHKMKKNKK